MAHDVQNTSSDANQILEEGTLAPDFELPSGPDQTIRLSTIQNQPVVLVFYPADWSPVCGDQLGLYNEIGDEFARHNAKLIGISVDGPWCHKAYREHRNLDLTLASDFEPKGAIARRYGVFRSGEGVAGRAIFVIDQARVIRWSYLSPIDVNPGADGILAALENLSKGNDK